KSIAGRNVSSRRAAVGRRADDAGDYRGDYMLELGGKVMTMRISWLVALLIVLAGPRIVLCQSEPVSAGQTLTLEEAIALALRDNRQVKNAALEVEKFDYRISAAKTHRLPEFKISALSSQLLSSLDFKFDRGVFGNYPTVGPIPAQDTVINTPRRPTVVVV